jgi:thiaminase (transcriptional activator TenA)
VHERTVPESASACESLRARCDELWRALLSHSFPNELAAGTLPLDRFAFYLEQDVVFLGFTMRALGLALARSRDEAEMRLLVEEAAQIVDRELAEERRLLVRVQEFAKIPQTRVVPAPAAIAYGGWLAATAVREEALDVLVALHPCIWSYAVIARELAPRSVEHPIYTEWLRFFAGPEYARAVAARTTALDALLAPLSEARIARLSLLFTTGARLALLFWNMAYGLEHWPDLREVT